MHAQDGGGGGSVGGGEGGGADGGGGHGHERVIAISPTDASPECTRRWNADL